MATLTVETGTGSTTANSYISLADANTYHEDRENPSAWFQALDADKTRALIIATQFIDETYLGRWLGRRANQTQALAWPRIGASDEDGWAIDSTTIPTRLKNALAEAAAAHLSETDGLWPNVSSDNDGITRERVKVGSIEQEIVYSGVKATNARLVKVDTLLAPYIRAANFMERA